MSHSCFETLSNPVKDQPYVERAQGTQGKTDQKFSKGKKPTKNLLPPGNTVMRLQSADPIGNIISGKYQMQGLGRYQVHINRNNPLQSYMLNILSLFDLTSIGGTCQRSSTESNCVCLSEEVNFKEVVLIMSLFRLLAFSMTAPSQHFRRGLASTE